MDFSEHQQLFLRTICTYFHENAEWPTYGWLDRVLRKQDKAIDVQVLGDELDRFMFDGPHAPVAITWDPKRATYLSIEALRTCQVEGICPELATDFEAFERVLLLCIERYESDEDNPCVQAANVQARLGLSDRELRVVFQLMLLSGLTAGSSPGNDVIGWYSDVASTIRVYRNATTTTDYFQIRQAEHERYRRAQQAASTIDFSLATLSSPYQYGARSAEGTAEESASLDSSPAEKSPPAIFICYRREDAIAYARGIAHDLKQHFGVLSPVLSVN